MPEAIVGDARRQLRQIGILLGLLTAIGPTAIDLYLPALTAIAHDLNAGPSAVQATLISFFYALVVGQVIAGPIADIYGRRRPLIAGLLLFLIASIACALAPDIETLIAARFFQGLGACVGVAISRAVVRDLRAGAAAAGLMATITLVSGVSPVFAPMLGSGLLLLVDWRGIFWVIAIATALLTILVLARLPETHPPSARAEAGFRPAIAIYARLLRDPRFVRLSCASAMAMSLSFAFLAGAPYVYAELYGFSPWGVASMLVLNGVCQIGVAQLNPSLIRRFGPWAVVRWAFAGMIGVAAVLLLLWWFGGVIPVQPLLVLVALIYMGIGLLLAPLTILILEPLGRVAGTGSALVGILQLGSGATVGALVSFTHDGTPGPMIAAMIGCILAGAIAARMAHAIKPAATAGN